MCTLQGWVIGLQASCVSGYGQCSWIAAGLQGVTKGVSNAEAPKQIQTTSLILQMHIVTHNGCNMHACAPAYLSVTRFVTHLA